MKNRERIIQNYIDGYNTFDIEKMTQDLDEAIVFKNISNGETAMTLTGLQAFKEQAQTALSYFSERTQAIKSVTHGKDETRVEINYHAILAIDLPNGLKKGDVLDLSGTSIFTFADDKVIRLTDVS